MKRETGRCTTFNSSKHRRCIRGDDPRRNVYPTPTGFVLGSSAHCTVQFGEHAYSPQLRCAYLHDATCFTINYPRWSACALQWPTANLCVWEGRFDHPFDEPQQVSCHHLYWVWRPIHLRCQIAAYITAALYQI